MLVRLNHFLIMVILSPSIKPTKNYNEENKVSPNDQQDHFPLGVALAQFNKNYIISRNSNGIVIVDQHAAHERLVLEKMKSARINKSIEKQILLLPEVINLQPIPLALIIENIDLLIRNRFCY